MSLDQDAINEQLALLAQYRRTLSHLLQQAAQFGGEIFAPPQTANGIAEARAEVERIKAALREGGVQVKDEPNDEEPPQVEPVHAHQAGDPQTTINTGGGDYVDTGGGDYAEGNIDKRQGGAFVERSTVLGDVIGQQIVLQAAALTPALHQLRAPVGDFVGREHEIDQHVQALSKAATSSVAAAISGVRGMGGIGKTELAYKVANKLKDVFPDAQLLIELRGASSSSLTPEDAVRQAIYAFERDSTLPDNLPQLQALYRAKLSGKRVLILADDAKDAAQVRSLLPPVGCALLVTSRNRFNLPGMAAIDLGALSPEEADELLLTICPRRGNAPFCYTPQADQGILNPESTSTIGTG